MKKIIFTVFLLGSILLLAGCWNQVEIEDRAIVLALGIDKAEREGMLAVTSQIIKPGEITLPGQSGGGNSKAVAIYTGTGYDLFDAVRGLARQTGRKLFYGETQVLIIGEELAREDIGTILDFMFRDHEPSLRIWLLVAKGRAKEVLETEIPTEKVWAFGIAKLVKAMRAHSKTPTVDILNFLLAVNSKTSSPIATAIELVGEEKEPEKEAAAPGKRPVLTGTAVFKEYQMVGWLDNTETRGMLWVKGEIISGIIVVPSPESPDEIIALEIIRADSEIEPKIRDGKITVTVKIKEEGNIGEVNPHKIKVTKPETLESIEANKNEVIKSEVLAAVAKAQEFNADVFGFGEAVRRKYPRDWPQYENNWDELFPALDVNVEVEAKIRRTGIIANPTNGSE